MNIICAKAFVFQKLSPFWGTLTTFCQTVFFFAHFSLFYSLGPFGTNSDNDLLSNIFIGIYLILLDFYDLNFNGLFGRSYHFERKLVNGENVCLKFFYFIINRTNFVRKLLILIKDIF